MAERKVIQLIKHPDHDQGPGEMLALCDDGTIWERCFKYDREGCGGPISNQRYEWDLIDGPPTLIR